MGFGVVGAEEGVLLGNMEGALEGKVLGIEVGLLIGDHLGARDGAAEGVELGRNLGEDDGAVPKKESTQSQYLVTKFYNHT